MNTEALQKFRVVLVEDHPMFREQLAQLINKEPGMTVCGEADNIHDAFQLTDRELEVFELIGHGRSTREISNQLHLGLSTVDTYRARIKTKLHLENSSQLCHEAIRWVSAGQKASV